MKNDSIATPEGRDLMNSLHANAHGSSARTKHEKAAASHDGPGSQATGHDAIC